MSFNGWDLVHEATNHFLAGQREGSVVPPVTVDMQVTLPDSFFPETQFGDNSQTCRVLGSDIDLKPVKTSVEAVVNNHRNGHRDDSSSA